MNEVIRAILTRRSVRSFDSRKIPLEDLKQLVEAARYAPSAMNRQTWKFTVVQNAGIIRRLAAVIAKELDRGEDYCFYGATALILASNDADNSNGAEDCACALQNIFLAAHSLGIGSVWINQLKGNCGRPAIRAVLDEMNLPKKHIVLGMAALGYPKGEIPPAVKRDDVAEWIL